MSGQEAIGAIEGKGHGATSKHSFNNSISDGYDPTQDPSLYGLAGYQLGASQANSSADGASNSDNSLEAMGKTMGMNGEEIKKFMDNLLQSITSTIKTDTDHAVEALKEINAEMEKNSQ